CAREEMDYW
nr:immunoglobulin heavy chain junction region [Mus musculus]